jgi:acetylornithine deacetylase/succinyl-diaminopimelate desuccinylase-like protein
MSTPLEPAAIEAETTELLQAMIRNACVNDGRPESGQEIRNADTLEAYLDGVGLAYERVDPTPGRRSLIVRIEGTEPSAPTVCFMGHTDVVPVTATGWRHDPFGGELISGEVWGRGAIDMLNLTASMAVATKHLAHSGFRPKGTLIFLAVADEEAASSHGARWLSEHEYDAIKADYVLTESGGIAMPTPAGTRVTLTVGEKGVAWRRLRITGTPGHGSMPYGADNAVITAAEVVRRLSQYQPRAKVDDVWKGLVKAYGFTPELEARLSDQACVDEAISQIDDVRTAKYVHACTHMTFSPNVVHGGIKTNVIPDTVELDVDIRTLPGETEADVHANLHEALGDLAHRVEVSHISDGLSTASPFDNSFVDSLERVVRVHYPDAKLVPRLTVGGTDARFFREKGAAAYGFGLFSTGISYEMFSSRFHGNDERIDTASLGLTTAMYAAVARDFLG